MILELSTLYTIMANRYSFITLWILSTFVHINFILLYSKHQLDHNSATAGAFGHVDVLWIGIYFSLEMLKRNETFLQVQQANSRLSCKNEVWTTNNYIPSRKKRFERLLMLLLIQVCMFYQCLTRDGRLWWWW